MLPPSTTSYAHIAQHIVTFLALLAAGLASLDILRNLAWVYPAHDRDGNEHDAGVEDVQRTSCEMMKPSLPCAYSTTRITDRTKIKMLTP